MDEVGRWAASGAMALTGDADGPPLAPPTTAAAELDLALGSLRLDARVLGERAAHLGLTRDGLRSCGGSTRLLESTDGWLALALARPDDVVSVPALFGVDAGDVDAADPWVTVERLVRERPAEEVVERAVVLGMAASRVGERSAADVPRARQGFAKPWTRVPFPSDSPRDLPAGGWTSTAGGIGAKRQPLVVDLSALWAGPLCTHLLALAGARVVKVESVTRPDGARDGDAGFHDLLNAGKESVALDLSDVEGRALLRGLVDAADIVVSSARARAIDQLGLDPDGFLDGGADRVWVAITGHGWALDRVGFGDDAAAAAGLVAWGSDGRPRFAGDAIADPLCGVFAAVDALGAWHEGGRHFVDAPLAGAAASVVGRAAPGEHGAVGEPARAGEPDGSGGWHLDGVPVAAPVPREPVGVAAALGADTDRVLGELLA